MGLIRLSVIVWLASLALISATVVAKTHPHSLVIDSREKVTSLTQDMFFWEDKDGKQSLNSSFRYFSMLKERSKTHPNNSQGFSHSSWWGAVVLINPKARSLPVVVRQEYTATDRVDFWLIDESGSRVIHHATGGDQYHLQKKAMKDRFPAVEMLIPPGKTILLTRIKSEGTVILDFTLWGSVRHFLESSSNDRIVMFALSSMLLIMATYNFFIFLQLRKIQYLVYVIFVVNMIYNGLAATGGHKLIFNNFTFVMNQGYITNSGLSTLFAAIFAYVFLNIKHQSIWLRGFGMFSCFLSISTMIVVYYNYNLGVKFSIPATISSVIFSLGSGIVLSLKGFRPAYFFTVAWTTILLAVFYRQFTITGLVNSSFFTNWATLVGAVIETAFISLALADSIRVKEQKSLASIRKLNKDLRKETDKVMHLNRNLEAMVEEQTREIKTIMDKVHVGIGVFGKNLRLTETYSNYTSHVLGIENVTEGTALLELFQDAEFTEETRNIIESILRVSFGQDIVNFLINEHQLPVDIELKKNDSHKHLLCNWTPVISNNLVEKVILTMMDVTEIKSLERDIQDKNIEAEYIAEIVNLDARKFQSFLESTRDFLADNQNLLDNFSELDKDICKRLMINLHTIKGNARTFGLKQLTPVVHSAENVIEEYLGDSSHLKRELIVRGHEDVWHSYHQYETLFSQKLQRGKQTGLTFEPEFLGELTQLQHSLLNQIEGLQAQQLRRMTHALEVKMYVSTKQIADDLVPEIKRLAKDLGKNTVALDYIGDEILLLPQASKVLQGAMIHLVRNSMDHGIETSDLRREKQKPISGLITLEVSLRQNEVLIRFSDDGAGLDLINLKKKFERLTQPSTEQISDRVEELAELVFSTGLSTSLGISEISGRGVGMGAVREQLTAIGGGVALVIDDGVLGKELHEIPTHTIPFALDLWIPRNFIVSVVDDSYPEVV
ncbi:MAG: Hpt domain-containing protein [Pseudobacteriovorax sp.]|nr:Hpt domain-containing protein [Pseudobacteriovorax sp.]